jgi:putative Mn2+ efflux pump MntP
MEFDMEIFRILVIGFTLAVDSFLISISLGVIQKKYSTKIALLTGLNFGFYQVLFFLLGMLLHFFAKNYIATFDRWIAFSILMIIGIKMILEARKNGKPQCLPNSKISFLTYLMLGVAVSIDAFAVGFTFHTLHIPLIGTSFSIFGFSFAFGFLGVQIGTFFGKKEITFLPYLAGILLCILGITALFF